MHAKDIPDKDLARLASTYASSLYLLGAREMDAEDAVWIAALAYGDLDRRRDQAIDEGTEGPVALIESNGIATASSPCACVQVEKCLRDNCAACCYCGAAISRFPRRPGKHTSEEPR